MIFQSTDVWLTTLLGLDLIHYFIAGFMLEALN
jgi:hypothetical protein